jgi:hypothetical protein
MAKNKEPAEDLQSVAQTQVAPADPPGSRLSHGDVAYDDDLDEFAFDEPIELVDAPVPLREPLTRTRKRRNQRALSGD